MHPSGLNTRWGRINDALAAASTETGRREAQQTYDARVHAMSSQGPRDSLLNTWIRVHHAWFGDRVPAMPLTPASIRAVVGCLLVAKYRSIENYVSRAKDAHCEKFKWESWHELEQRRSTAAAKRGRGPSHQTAEIPFEDACEDEARTRVPRLTQNMWSNR